MKDTSTALVALPEAEEASTNTPPNYAIVPHDLEKALDIHVGLPGASQRGLLSDAYYLFGPGRVLANQILGFSGIVAVLSIGLGVATWGFATLTLQLFIGLLTGDPPRL
jgi:hypothetical protein